MKIILMVLFILLLPFAYSYNAWYEFDMNENITISTTVYNSTSQLCVNCDCNLTVYNPYPYENFINLTTYLYNNGNGIYSKNIGKLQYNKQIYPLSIVCNDSGFFYGTDNRDGIKIGETLFDYSAIIIALVGIGAALLFGSFMIDKNLIDLRLMAFFSSFAFFIGAMFTGLQIVKLSPSSENFIIIFEIMFYAILAVYLVMVYLYVKFRIAEALKQGQKSVMKN